MKILHTSDWHLGQSFFTKSRKHEHAAFLNWIIEQVEANDVDAVIVAGDVFDTGTPPSYARELYHAFIGALQGKQCTLVVLGGNHDSVSVLNESKALLQYLNSYVVPSTYGDIDNQVITLNKKNGEAGAVLCAVPFIRPRDVIVSEAGQSATDKRQALGDAIKQHYATLYENAVSKRNELLEKKATNQTNLPIIATGHLTALGVSQSESVRDIYIGTLEGFDAGGFPPADYIALGHIHRPQKVAKQEHIRYSGSPIPLSFDELNTQKQVVLVEFPQSDAQELSQEAMQTSEQNDVHCKPIITSLPVPRFQAMTTIRGDLKHIEQAINTSEEIAKASFDTPVWLCIEVETQDYLTDLQQRVQALLDDKPAEILQLKRVREKKAKPLSQQSHVQLSELSVDEVFEARLALEQIDDQTNDVSANDSDSDSGASSRVARMKHLFKEAVFSIQNNAEDAAGQIGDKHGAEINKEQR